MWQLISIALITFVANGIGMISGFGLGTLMTPVLLLFLPFPQTIFFVCIVHWFHNVWKLVFFGRKVDWYLFLLFGASSVIGAFIGARLVVKGQGEMLSAFMGAFLVLYVLIIFFMPALKITRTWVTGVIGGALSGFFAGIFGIRGALKSMFLSAFDLRKSTYIGTIGALSFLLDSTRLVTYFAEGIRLEPSLAYGLFLFIPVSFIGAWLGKYLIYRIPQEQFRNVIAVFLFLIGVKLLLTPLF